MKTHTLFITLLLACICGEKINAQTDSSTIEEVVLALDTFDNGAGGSTGFQSGDAYYATIYDTSFGGFWSGGWAASNKTDSATSGYMNLYSAKTAGGVHGSSNYAIGTQNSVIRLTGSALGDSLLGIYVTNTTYAHNSMRDGDMFAKKFGGASGNDPDWFLLTIKKYYQGVLSNDSVYFYLADYRFNNNANDYILKSWQWINLTSLGRADSLVFSLNSSDVGGFGMNTPAYFAIDNLMHRSPIIGINESMPLASVQLFPNPATENLTLKLPSETLNEKCTLTVFDMNGRLVLNTGFIAGGIHQLNLSDLTSGNYLIQLKSENYFGSGKFVKQ